MKIYLNGTDIAPAVSVSSASIIDTAGGKLDNVELGFTDIGGLWSKWAPTVGMSLQVEANGFDTGICFVDQIGQERGIYVLRALSGPIESKQQRSRSWEQVTLYQLAADVASMYGFAVSGFNVEYPTYDWVDQAGESDFAFLSRICSREAYCLKVTNKAVVLYGEASMEAQSPVRTIFAGDWCRTPDYRQNPSPYAACSVTYGNISATFTAPGRTGQTLVLGDIRVTDIGEAQRFSKGMLRQQHREEHIITGNIFLDLTLAGGCMVTVSGIGTADGVYMVDQAEHDIISGITSLRLRRKIEGGY